MDRYFAKFPTTVYNGTAVKDISRRVGITEANYHTPNLFYPVEIRAGNRPDIIADAFYQDSELDWLVYMSNQVVDPYYGWYLSEEEFNSFLADKYGDYDLPRKKIKFWRNNWQADDTQITPTYYEQTLALDLKKYYGPKYGVNSKIMYYERKKTDWVVNTNKIFRYDVTYSNGNSFTTGEILDIKYSGNVVGGAEVLSSNASSLIVQHVTGNAVANSTWTKVLYGESSNTSATTSLTTTLQENLTNAEIALWTPVTYYDWEVEKNEEKKHIYLLNPDVVMDTSNDIRKKLQE